MQKDEDNLNNIDPKDLMAVERATTALIGTSISLIILGFVVEKFELFLRLIVVELNGKGADKMPQVSHASFYNYLGIFIVIAGICLAVYTYFYYTQWIKNLQQRKINSDKKIYFLLSLFISLVGLILLISMLLF